jgi:hypothetical protein
MVDYRKIAGWLVLASYLFANTLAASWHDHHDHAACPSAPADHCRNHCDHYHGDQCAAHHDHDCDHDDDQTSGDDQGTPHHCVVCEFLALAPLPVAIPALIAAGAAIPAAVVVPVVRLAEAPLQAHPARGPPAVG